jgi:gluconolactonase
VVGRRVYRASSRARAMVTPQGRLYTAERDGHRVVPKERDGRETVIASEYEGKRLNSPNDVVVRRDGQVYFSDPASATVLDSRELSFNGPVPCNPTGQGHLDCEDATSQRSGAWTRTGMLRTNARSFPELVARRTVFALRRTATCMSQRRGIAIYTPDAKRAKMIEFPETPVNCAFGGPNLQTLYVTARSSVQSIARAYRTRAHRSING